MYSGFALTLLKWFEEYGRELPWRDTRDPYAIWLSEIILQQTRVQQGWAYWERFMQRWPTVDQLAAASEDDVLRLWQGLGYYSRARNLHTAARQIVQMGAFPRTFDQLRQLKGVGDYTAAAIASMAFDQPTAVVDGNVYRVLARHFGIHTPINSHEGKEEFALLAQQLLPEDEAATYNQAIMDFGAIQCTPHSPKCIVCPLQESCLALRSGMVEQLPVKLQKVNVKERRLVYIYIRCNGQTAIRRRGEGDIWQGLWEPVLVEEGESVTHFVQTMFQDTSSMPSLKLLKSGFRHVLTHRILYCDFYLLQSETKPVLPNGYRWIDESELDKYALPRMVELLLQALC
jgi:A/G-specific adenine glycosylase